MLRRCFRSLIKQGVLTDFFTFDVAVYVPEYISGAVGYDLILRRVVQHGPEREWRRFQFVEFGYNLQRIAAADRNGGPRR
jgi:hypothetical protein